MPHMETVSSCTYWPTSTAYCVGGWRDPVKKCEGGALRQGRGSARAYVGHVWRLGLDTLLPLYEAVFGSLLDNNQGFVKHVRVHHRGSQLRLLVLVL